MKSHMSLFSNGFLVLFILQPRHCVVDNITTVQIQSWMHLDLQMDRSWLHNVHIAYLAQKLGLVNCCNCDFMHWQMWIRLAAFYKFGRTPSVNALKIPHTKM
jgi:hypothetical protein